MNNIINTRGMLGWIYSLFEAWWIVVISTFIVSCIIGLFSSFLIGLLYVLSYVVWVKTGENRTAKAKKILGVAVSHIRDWWICRPSFTE